MFPLPGLWYDTNIVMNCDQLFDDLALYELKQRCIESQRDYLRWMEDYKSHCVRLSLAKPPQEELDLRRELFGTALEGLLLVKRLLATVSDEQREGLEPQTQALAKLLLELQEHPGPKFSWLFSGHEVGMSTYRFYVCLRYIFCRATGLMLFFLRGAGIAYTAIHTTTDWEGPFIYSSEYDRRIASRNRFNTWSKQMRRYD